MTLEALALAAAVLASIPASLLLFNLVFYRRAPEFGAPGRCMTSSVTGCWKAADLQARRLTPLRLAIV